MESTFNIDNSENEKLILEKNNFESNKYYQEIKSEMFDLFKVEKENNPSLEITEEQVTRFCKDLFLSNTALKLEEKDNQVLDINNDFLNLWKSLLSNAPGVGPIFGAIFSFLGRNDLENLMKKILKKVEEIVKKAIEAEERRQCEIVFTNIKSIGEKHLDLTTRWYDSNGIKSLSYNGEEIRPKDSINASSKELEAMIHASFLDLRNECIKGINRFSEKKYAGHTVTFLIYTVCIYCSFIRDTIKWGKQMNFPPEIIDGTSSKPSLLKEHQQLLENSIKKIVNGCLAHTNMYNDTLEGYWQYPSPLRPPMGPPPFWVEPTGLSWVSPPDLNVGLSLYFSSKVVYPNGVTLLKADSSKQFTLPNRKDEYYLNIESHVNKKSYPRSTYPSFRFGSFALYPSLIFIEPLEFVIKNQNKFNRKVAISIVHFMVGEAYWQIDCYNNKPGESGSFSKTYSKLISDSHVNPIQVNTDSCGIIKLDTVSTNHQYIKLTCLRSPPVLGKIQCGYLFKSQIYSIHIKDE